MRILAVCLLALPVIAAERSPQLRPPVIGYSIDGGQLRALWGVPGAARWSEPIAKPDGVSDLAIAAGQSWMIGRQGDRLVSIALDGLTAGEAVTIEGSSSEADLFAFSPSGSAAVAYSRRTGRVQVIAGGRVAWESFAAARAIAVDDEATAVAAAGSGITLLRNGAAPRLISNLRVSAIGFAPGRDELLAVSGDELIAIEEPALRARQRVLARNAGFENATAVIASRGSAWVASAKLYSVDGESGSVTVSDVAAEGAAASRLDGAVMTKAGLAGEVR